MNGSRKFSVQPHPIIVHDASGILHDHADARNAVVGALDVHDVEDVLLAPISLWRSAKGRKEIHQNVGQASDGKSIAHKIIQLSGKIDFPSINSVVKNARNYLNKRTRRQ